VQACREEGGPDFGLTSTAFVLVDSLGRVGALKLWLTYLLCVMGTCIKHIPDCSSRKPVRAKPREITTAASELWLIDRPRSLFALRSDLLCFDTCCKVRQEALR